MTTTPFKYNYDRKFRFPINGDAWECYLITEEEATELDMEINDTEEGFGGITKTDQKCIFIVEGYVTPQVVIHELFHAYVDYLHLSSADITVTQFEEIIAQFLGERLEKFVESSKLLHDKFKRLGGSK